MKCPSCGLRVPDGAFTCPHCHSALDVTQKISLEKATWCPDCGALVAPGAKTCPKCGASVVKEKPPAHPVRDLDLPEIGNTGVLVAGDAADETGTIAGVESAIPAEGDAQSPTARRDRIPRARSFLLAALLAVLVVGGAALLITHPWDPSATQTRATEPADTSMSGFPGFLESLTGQDGGTTTATTTKEESGEEKAEELTPLEAVQQAYDELASLAEEVDASEEALRSEGISGDAETRAAGLSDAEAVSIEVSNLISSAQGLDDSDGAYADAISNLVTLGNWLRNRCDALTEAWQRSVDSSDPAADEASILAPVESASAYASLFEENLEQWSSELTAG